MDSFLPVQAVDCRRPGREIRPRLQVSRSRIRQAFSIALMSLPLRYAHGAAGSGIDVRRRCGAIISRAMDRNARIPVISRAGQVVDASYANLFRVE